MKVYAEIISELGHWQENLKTGILLAHNAQRHDIAGQEVQSFLGARQNLSPPIRAADVSY